MKTQGGCDTCDMGAVDICSPCFLGCCFVFQAYEGCFSFDMYYCTYFCVRESNKAGETKPEEQTKNAPPAVNVRLHRLRDFQ